MSASITAAATVPGQAVEDPRVTRFLTIRYKLYKRKDKLTATLDAVVDKLDPRSAQEDYLRRRQRLLEQVEQARGDVRVASDPAMKAAMTEASKAVKFDDLMIAAALKQGDRPDYGEARTLLRIKAEKLTSALTAADALAGDREAANPVLVRKLGDVEAMLKRDRTLISTADSKAWTARRDMIETSLHAGSDPVATLMTLAEKLDGEVRLKVSAAALTLKQLGEERTRLNNALTKTDMTPKEMAAVDAVLTQAARQAAALDFAAARQSLTAAAKAIGPVDPNAALPKMADCESLRQVLHNRAASLVPGSKADGTPAGGGGAVSPAARTRAVALLHRLDDLKGLCGQSDEVAVDAAQRLKACQDELDAILKQDKEAEQYQAVKAGVASNFEKDVSKLKTALARQTPKDGAFVKLETRIALLEQSYAEKWPALMIRADVDRSGLLTELAALETALAGLQAPRRDQGPKPSAWTADFYDAKDQLTRVTDQAAKRNVELLQRFGLLGAMPKLVAEAGGLLTAAKPGAGEGRVREITRLLLDTVNVVEAQLAASGPEKLKQNQEAGVNAAENLIDRVNQALTLFEEARPGKKEAWAKMQAKRVRSSLFSDDDERTFRAQYGKSIKDDLNALETMLRCKDPGAQAKAMDQVIALQNRVAAFEKMAQAADKPQETETGGPPTFVALAKRIADVEKLLALCGKDKDVSSRVELLKKWNDRVGLLTGRLGAAEPTELAADIAALRAEMAKHLPTIRTEAAEADKQQKFVQALSLQLRKRRGSLDPKDAALGDDLQRQCDAMIDSLAKWRTADPGYGQLKTSVDVLLKTNRTAEEAGAHGKRSEAATKSAEEVGQAKRLLLKLIDVDLKLRRETFSDIKDAKLRKLMGKLADDLTKEAEKALESLATNRDPAAAESFVASALRELDQTALSAQGDKLTRRGDLTRLDELWAGSVGRLRAQLAALEKAVADATAEMPEDIKKAGGSLKAMVTGEVAALFEPTAFKANLLALDDDDADRRATQRELVLREVRRLRRVMESDLRVRMLAVDNPFGVPIPVVEIESRLFDIEINVTRFAGS